MKQNIYDHPDFFNGYKELRQSKCNYNNLLEQPALKVLLPELNGKKILDIGCGMGDFASYCIQQGAAHVTGIDISSNMISIARNNNAHNFIQYIQEALEDIDLAPLSFDIVNSSLAFHYMEDFDAITSKIANALHENGFLIFSMEHPIATARREMDKWINDENGNHLHYTIDNYQEEGQRSERWYIDGVIKYHRTLSTIINTLISHQLQIEKIIEPLPTEEAIEQLPSLQKEYRRPSFLIIKAKKVTLK
ncbi:class I SAM-dependent methyltransferase [Viridibacillus sp. YIM B01967]|uniref:Class I SAM-dependent methyltransferase n=1 Tax=Viridibacillus soli TaxID=2798301 RepID=A0ABS1HA65_9BACL|nr:class I SAM-dependent methyltransferase [Viridibacillus soli]MBK3496307.1 class I SAM-dependent methyltransferase [Viridibacillus soli]